MRGSATENALSRYRLCAATPSFATDYALSRHRSCVGRQETRRLLRDLMHSDTTDYATAAGPLIAVKWGATDYA